MLESSMYIGIVVVSKDDEGNKTVRYHNHGPDWHELGYDDVLAMEGALKPLRKKLADIGEEAEDILHKAGLARAEADTKGGNKTRPTVG